MLIYNVKEKLLLDMPTELKGTTVKYAAWGSPCGEEIVEFENITGLKYGHVSVPQCDYITKIIGLIAADQAPDVIS